MKKIKNEYKSFLDDLENNIKNKEDLDYIKKRFYEFFEVILNQIEAIADYKAEQIEQMEKRQEEIEAKMMRMQGVLDNIEKDIYSEDGFDFEIVCPYCNYEFFIDMDENKTEVQCPECENIIELDWLGDNEESSSGCSGSCHGCDGCNNEDDM